MNATQRRRSSIGLLVLLAACASAQDRLEEGIRLQSQGRYFQAAYRYIDALDKDPGLTEARQRLLEVGDSAITLTLRSAADLAVQGEHVTAGEWFEDVDGLLLAARGVGVQIPTPGDFRDLRRAAFERAVEALLTDAEELEARGDFAGARRALVRARGQFEPSAEQRDRSLAAEGDLLLDWADAELAAGRYRSAHSLAEEAMVFHVPTDPDVEREARAIQAQALDLGTVVVAVLPVTSTTQAEETVGPDLGIQLADDLELDFWRDPPPFIGVVDPVVVRREVRRVQRPGRTLSAYEVEDVLGAVGAHLGALIELSLVVVQETDVRTSGRQTRTRDGRNTSYTVEEGNLVYDAVMNVVVVDPRGREVTDRDFRVQQTGRFERGVYGGDWRELDLSRNEARLFDRGVMAEQRAAVERALVAELVPAVADRVFDAVLSVVP